MKKKFGLGLAQLIGPSKTDDRHVIAGDIPVLGQGSPPPSPYPGQRAPLPQNLEAELRMACLGVLSNQRPSHLPAYINSNEESSRGPTKEKAPLDYAAIKQSLDKPSDVVSQPSSKRRSTRVLDPTSTEMMELQAAVESVKYAYKPDTATADLFAGRRGSSDVPPSATANTMRRRDELLATDSLHHRNTPSSGLTANPSKHSTDRSKIPQRSASHGTSGSTPQTDTTEYPWSVSTAPTSAGVTPARNSKRASAHLHLEQDAIHKTDQNSVDSNRHDTDKRRKNPAVPGGRRPSEPDRPEPQSNTRPPSRVRSIRSMKSVRSIKSFTSSIKDGIKDYVRPGSGRSSSRGRSSHHRHQSSDKSFDPDRQDRGPATRPPPRRDWRNWGRSSKDDYNANSSGDVSRSSSIRGRSENRKPSSAKADIDLNRELPPLPSLDQWHSQERVKPQHIADLRSPNSHTKASLTSDRSVQPPVRVLTSSAVTERDEIVAARLGSPTKSRPDVYQPTRARKPVGSGLRSPPARTTEFASSIDADSGVRDGDVRIEFGIKDLMPTYSSKSTPAHSHSNSRSIASESNFDAKPRFRTAASVDSHGRSGSAVSRTLSLKQSHPPMLLDKSKSSRSLPTTAPSFSRHRKYDQSDIPPALDSNVANQGRKVATKSSQDAANRRYRHMAEIQSPPIAPQGVDKDDKRAWWHLKSKQKKPTTWMDQLEKLGIRDGVLLNEQGAGSPIVRY